MDLQNQNQDQTKQEGKGWEELRLSKISLRGIKRAECSSQCLNESLGRERNSLLNTSKKTENEDFFEEWQKYYL